MLHGFHVFSASVVRCNSHTKQLTCGSKAAVQWFSLCPQAYVHCHNLSLQHFFTPRTHLCPAAVTPHPLCMLSPGSLGSTQTPSQMPRVDGVTQHAAFVPGLSLSSTLLRLLLGGTSRVFMPETSHSTDTTCFLYPCLSWWAYGCVHLLAVWISPL